MCRGAAVAAVALFGVVAISAPAAAGFGVEALSWQPCGGATNFQCATSQIPIDRCDSALALDSNEDHGVGAVTWVTRLSQAQEQSYGQFADWCGRTAAGAFYPRDARGVLDQL